VMRCSAYGRRRLAFASVVVMRPCSNRLWARFARISRWCEGLPPRRGPVVGAGMSLLLNQWCQSSSVLLVLGESGVLVERVDDGGRIEARRAVLERQTQLGELGLDLVDRLRPEVADVQQVLLAARDELTHGVDALALEA